MSVSPSARFAANMVEKTASNTHRHTHTHKAVVGGLRSIDHADRLRWRRRRNVREKVPRLGVLTLLAEAGLLAAAAAASRLDDARFNEYAEVK